MKNKLVFLFATGWLASLGSFLVTSKAWAGDCGFLDVTCSPSRWKTPGETGNDLTKPVLGRCGVPGEGTIKVNNKLATRVFVVIDKKDGTGGPSEKELGPGESMSTGICNQGGARIKVFTPVSCGKTLLGESKFNRVYNNETANITTKGINFEVGDVLDPIARVAGFTLTYIAQLKGVPPQFLAELGVNEAEVLAKCSSITSISDGTTCAKSIYKWLPKDLLAEIKNDRCLSKVVEQGNSQPSTPFTPGSGQPAPRERWLW